MALLSHATISASFSLSLSPLHVGHQGFTAALYSPQMWSAPAENLFGALLLSNVASSKDDIRDTQGRPQDFLQGVQSRDHSSNIFLLCVDAVLYTRSHCN